MRTIEIFERGARYLARTVSPEHADEAARTVAGPRAVSDAIVVKSR